MLLFGEGWFRLAPDLHEESLRQIERIAASPVLRGSESLCRLLRYLGQHTLDNPGVPIREHQIAVDVFGRPEGFDPRLDSTVRVQTGRLRARLAEYQRGAGDAIVVDIPRGTYQVTFQARQAPSPVNEIATQPAEPVRGRSPWMIAFLVMTAVALALALVLILR